MALQAGLILFFVFVVLLIVGMPIAISIAVSSIATLLMVVPFEIAVFTSAQKMVSSLNSFSLVAIPFFVLSGIIMNNGGIAEKLVNFAMLFVGRIPGGLAHTNVLGNALFGSMSSSAIAASTAIGGVLIPQQIKAGYDRKFATAVNIASAPTGMVIPPSTAFIMFSLVAGGASISSLFLGGYLVGALWSLAIMLVAYVHAKKNKYQTMKASEMGSAVKIIKEAIPSVMLIVIIIGGILTGIFTAIEASAIAVAYSLLIAMFFYKTVTVKDIYPMLKEAVLTTGTITFLLATSSMMSFAMAFTGIPQAISAAILGLTTNKFLILLLVNVVLLIVGMFMDVGPAILIFTPIFLPVITSVGVDPVHFGLFAIMNLCVGSITPPVGTGLYVGASVGGVKAEQMLKPLVPFYLAILAVLFLITYFPGLVMWLPNMAG
ncbi:TRAP transporter large permease [Trichococcus shcherbakoviae]|jgi:tripartite ATP-independent transporter DctM subunit|uniref:TRAP transporter large permease n=2 Tax=Trichococcus TaxID=82802 RepID=A0A5C5E9R5_9LACT|nr:TRAP transporter large permease [Trichococcus shcherbakoviae]TNV69714.1 TRAP transporter large permease [Trichococcus shcherbakoviae subsp. psychrophilus]